MWLLALILAPGRAQGRFKSVMVVVSPCRSDMSAQGLAPWAHLADGRLTLVLVRECSTLQYLRFLISIPRHGALACRPGVHRRPQQWSRPVLTTCARASEQGHWPT